MSEEIDNQVEQMLLGESEQDTGEHLTADNVIEHRLLMCGDDSPEMLYTSTLVSVQAHNVSFGQLHLIDEETLRKFVREEVHRALYPAAEMANPHEHRRIEMVEETGRKWRGVLYLVEEDQ